MEARVGVEGGARKFLQQPQKSQQHHHYHTQQQQQPQPQPQIGTVPQLLAGGIAGAFSKTCTAPLARLTILFQVQGMHSDIAVLSKPSICREALRIVNEEGFRAFWKGNLVTIAHRLPYSSVNFYSYERYKSLLKTIPGLDGKGGNAGADIFVHFVGGGLAGITAAAATYPLDLVRTRLAAQCAATFPLDLVRRRKQLEGAGGRARVYNTGIMGIFKHIIKTEGLRGLYRGIMPEYYKVVPSVGIVFMTYETLKKLLSQGPFDS
uniref:Mitochondrial coenzyme A transporter SLC25A42-like n=1 Tax=Nicotiana sylvestris TaxID=4096 RepID=A0A1U7VBW6_NICSY|nr:PREDICTED: mitochondrial coenzyme A transporter SLC25A42-like [Nicotiana sylvestris]